MKADFGKLAGVGFAEVRQDVVLGQAIGEGAVLFGGPFFISAARFPIGNVAFGYRVSVFFESTDDFLVGNVVAQHAIDQVAFEEGEAGDFAVADLLWSRLDCWINGLVDWWIPAFARRFGAAGWMLDGHRIPDAGSAFV